MMTDNELKAMATGPAPKGTGSGFRDGGGSTQKERVIPYPKAEWMLWANIPKATLNEAVLMSLNLEPQPMPIVEFPHHAPQRYAKPGREFERRLSIASAHVDAAGPLHPLGYMPMLNGPAGATVSLGEFAAWAIGMGWELPELFPRDAMPTAPAQSPAPTETKAQRQDLRLNACEAAGLVMPKSSAGRLPDGVGIVADSAGVTRQAFSADVKAALKRRESVKREGVTVHRA